MKSGTNRLGESILKIMRKIKKEKRKYDCKVRERFIGVNSEGSKIYFMEMA